MANLSNQHNEPNLDQLLTDYAEALKGLPSQSKSSSRQVLKVLRSRDRLQDTLSQVAQLDDEQLVTLAELDLELKQRSDIVCADKELQQMRQSLLPPESAWWWYLDPATEDSKSKSWLDRFDWVWNVGTVVCLVVATSFITQTAKAFSNEGFDFLGTLSTIGQGAGLAFVAGGALTDKGKKAVESTLMSMKVPASLHAEATFGASLLLLGAAYGIHQNLPKVGDFYFDQAQQHEKNGEWSQALKSYKRALNFAQDDYKSQIAVGFLYEKLGNFDKAIEVYKSGSVYGIPQFLNAQARVMLMAELQKNNWQGGINEEVVREAKSLLDRADKATTNYSLKWDDPSKDYRLSTDIQINKAIAIMAQLKYEKNISEKTRNSLNEIADSLIWLDSSIKKESAEPKNSVTEASTLGTSRAKCYYQQAFFIGRLSGSPRVNGFDPLVKQDDELDACVFELSIGAKFYIPSDRNLLKNYRFAGSQSDRYFSSEVQDISSFMELLYRYPSEAISKYKNRIVLIQDSEIWTNLANQWSQIIQKNYVKGDKKYNQDIIWRFLLSKDGELIAYFAYDDLSRELGNAQPYIAQALEKKTINTLSAELANEGKIEFVDFKVVLSPEGKVKHILPWQMAYPTLGKYLSESCHKENCNNLILESHISSVFKNYVPDLNNPSELGVLQAILRLNLGFWGIMTDKGIYYEDPAIFQLKVSADGQIVDYEATNQVAIQKLEKKLPFNGYNLKTPQFPELVKAPYAYFKMEVRGLQIKFAPWSDPK
jgi:tetratricopeptide (TPR) repeat protein